MTSTPISRLLPKSRFIRNVSLLAGGTLLGQLIVVMASPVLTRLYTPENFGLLAVFSSIISTTGVVGMLRYQLAIPLPESKKTASSALFLSIIILFAFTIIVAACTYPFTHIIAEALNTPQLADYFFLVPLGIVLIGLNDTLRYWSVRCGHFGPIAQSKLVQPFTMTLVQVGGVSLGPIALLVGRLAGQAGAIINLLVASIRTTPPLKRGLRADSLLYTGQRYSHFPIYSSWTALLNKAGTELPPLMFAAFFSSSAAGLFMLAHRVLAMPAHMISRSVADVFFSRAPAEHRKNNLAPLAFRVHIVLSQLAMPPLIILMLAGPQIFSIAFGNDWEQAGTLSRWLAPWLYTVFVISPLRLFTILEKQKQGLRFQYILFSIQVAGIVIGIYQNSMVLSVALMAIGSAACWQAALLWFASQLNISWKLIFTELIKTFGYSVGLSAPLALGYFLNVDRLIIIALVLLCAMGTCLFYLFVIQRSQKTLTPI